MKILIVSAHSTNYNGQKRFQDFVSLIKDVIYTHCFNNITQVFTKQRQSMVSFPEVVVRDLSNLDDYLYEQSS